jgi:hypothetical protein
MPWMLTLNSDLAEEEMLRELEFKTHSQVQMQYAFPAGGEDVHEP